jgi:hypothetical protein
MRLLEVLDLADMPGRMGELKADALASTARACSFLPIIVQNKR